MGEARSVVYSMIYVLSISFQVAGALMLMLFSISTKRLDVIRTFAKSHVIMRNGDTKELSYNHDAFVETFSTAYFSKFSVAYISFGYILGVFGDIEESSRWKAVAGIIAATSVLVLSTQLIVKKLLKKEMVQKRITNEELVRAGVEPDQKSISTKEIDQSFEDVFGKR